MTEEASIKSQLIGLWCVVIFTVLVLIGWIGLAHFWLPAAADLGQAGTKVFYTVTHQTGMLWGNSILIVACAFLVPASIQFGLCLSDIEGPKPLWSITTAISGILIAVIVFFNACMWIGAAYRPDAGGDVVVMLNDLAWFAFLLGWVFLSLQMVAAAVVALSDRRSKPMIPRWVSIASIVGAILLICAGGPAFAKTGPFAYNGILAFYMPVVIWAIWLDGHAYYMRRELRARRTQTAHSPTVPVQGADLV